MTKDKDAIEESITEKRDAEEVNLFHKILQEFETDVVNGKVKMMLRRKQVNEIFWEIVDGIRAIDKKYPGKEKKNG